MKQSLLLITGLFFLTSSTFAQQKSLFQPDSTLNNLSLFKTWKPFNQGVLGKTNESAIISFNPLMKDFSKLMFKDSHNIAGPKKDDEFVSEMPIIEPKGNYPMRIVPIDSTIQYSLLIVKPN
ncbi:hypothetical protein [Confluentibacter sediminis]|uniref:hypothetical protein n=1 Tax=Confluentibacter sediminis TaxID=2219045 RepID=UPI000DAD7583|nr:hypothetical protein [Confluentibacter sediminis]